MILYKVTTVSGEVSQVEVNWVLAESGVKAVELVIDKNIKSKRKLASINVKEIIKESEILKSK